MRNLKETWQAYRELDRYLERQAHRARSKRGEEKWARRRELNDQAYFVTLFACFEDRVTELCRRLVKKKQNLRPWRQRRLWDTVDTDRIDLMSFMRKVALLIEKGSADFGKVTELYRDRCFIAHGTAGQVGPLDVPSRYRQIARLWRALRP